MSIYGPTFHVTPVDLCIIFQCNLYVSCNMSCGNKIVSKIVSDTFGVLSCQFWSTVSFGTVKSVMTVLSLEVFLSEALHIVDMWQYNVFCI